MTSVSKNAGIAVTTNATMARPKGCVRAVRRRARPRESGDQLCDAMSKINRQTQDCAKLDYDGVHLPITVGQIDMEQRFEQFADVR